MTAPQKRRETIRKRLDFSFASRTSTSRNKCRRPRRFVTSVVNARSATASDDQPDFGAIAAGVIAFRTATDRRRRLSTAVRIRIQNAYEIQPPPEVALLTAIRSWALQLRRVVTSG